MLLCVVLASTSPHHMLIGILLTKALCQLHFYQGENLSKSYQESETLRHTDNIPWSFFSYSGPVS